MERYRLDILHKRTSTTFKNQEQSDLAEPKQASGISDKPLTGKNLGSGDALSTHPSRRGFKGVWRSAIQKKPAMLTEFQSSFTERENRLSWQVAAVATLLQREVAACRGPGLNATARMAVRGFATCFCERPLTSNSPQQGLRTTAFKLCSRR